MAAKAEHYRALVDMGSNGIRFSISDLSPATARIMPTVYQDRCGISLYNAQYSSGQKIPIPPTVIREVLAALSRFKVTCQDYGVPDTQIRVVATEATREAINSTDFRQAIQDRTGWEVELLSKEEEGRIGALGVASSFSSVKGLVMDLGGGSVQLTWLIAEHGTVRTSPKGAISLPYGAAALTLRLAEAEQKGSAATDRLRTEMIAQLRQAYTDLAIPHDLTAHATAHDGLSLYLSGGGFRGWGYLLLAQHAVQPYPIPIINGFRAPRASFQNTLALQALASEDAPSIFRVSARRASQVPAVAFLVSALAHALPPIRQALFSQGGVREGLLYASLPAEIQAAHPLVAATAPYAPPSAAAIRALLAAAVPDPHALALDPDAAVQMISHPPFLHALANMIHLHAPLPTESRAASALRATTTGVLAAAHGLSHADRALLALTLCERWGGEGKIAPTDKEFLARMREVVGDELGWWARYVGAVAGLVGAVYPGGVVRVGAERLVVEGRWMEEVKGKGKRAGEVGIEVVVRVRNGDGVFVEGGVKALERVGKRKNWGGGRQGYGFKVEVVVKEDL